jgi:tRNA (guanine-N7-)-methyltransferase
MGQFKNQSEAEAAGVYISKVKSFVKREGRLTKGQAKAFDDYWSKMGIEVSDTTLNFSKLFGNDHPVVLEIGFGMGRSLVEMAQAQPHLNFLGIEVHRPGVGACLAYAGELQLSNLKVIEHDAVEVLKNNIPTASLERLQLFFPDPWHKKRHHKRRIVQADFVELVAKKLKPAGQSHMATDWEPYAHHMLEVMQKSEVFKNTSQTNDFVPRPDYRPITKFETRGQRLGHGVWDLIFEKV